MALGHPPQDVFADQPDKAAGEAAPIGVLFVHGIGEQRRGDTLLHFGEPLIRWLQDWVHPPGGAASAPPAIARGGLGPAGDDTPSRVGSGEVCLAIDDVWLAQPVVAQSLSPSHARLRATGLAAAGCAHDTAQWIFAECWWADTFRPPPFRQVAAWAMGIGPLMIRTFRPHLTLLSGDSEGPERPQSAGARLLVMISEMWEFYTIVLLCLLAIATEALMAALLLLALVPPLRRIVVAVQLRLAGSLGDSYVLAVSPLRRAAMTSQVRRDIAWLRESGCRRIAVVAHSQGAAVAYEALQDCREQPIEILITFGAGIAKLKRIQYLLPHAGAIAALSLLQAAVFTALFPVMFAGVLLQWPSWVGMAWLIIASFAIALSELALQQKYIQPSRAAARVGADEVATVAWDDFYASADPVPDGPLFDPTAAGSACRSLQIENRRSVAADHTTYWQNREQFLAHVARKLAALANWSLFREDDPLIAAAWRRRTRRVTGLARARVAVACSYPLVLVTVGLLGGWLPLGEWAAARLADLSRLLPGSIGGALREPLEGRPIAYLLPPPILAACTLWYLTVLVPLRLRWDQQEAALIFRRHQERRHAAARSLFYVGAAGPPTALWLTMFIAGATVGEPSSPVTLLVFALMTGPLWLVPVGLLGVDWLRRDAPSADDGTGSD